MLKVINLDAYFAKFHDTFRRRSWPSSTANT